MIGESEEVLNNRRHQTRRPTSGYNNAGYKAAAYRYMNAWESQQGGANEQDDVISKEQLANQDISDVKSIFTSLCQTSTMHGLTSLQSAKGQRLIYILNYSWIN